MDEFERSEAREKLLRDIAGRIEEQLEQLEADVDVLEEYFPIYAGLLGKSAAALKNDRELLISGANAVQRRRKQIEAAREAAKAEQAWESGVRS